MGILTLIYTLLRKSHSIKKTLSRTSVFEICTFRVLTYWLNGKRSRASWASTLWNEPDVRKNFLGRLCLVCMTAFKVPFSHLGAYYTFRIEHFSFNFTKRTRAKCLLSLVINAIITPMGAMLPIPTLFTFNINNFRLLTWGPGIPGGPGLP